MNRLKKSCYDLLKFDKMQQYFAEKICLPGTKCSGRNNNKGKSIISRWLKKLLTNKVDLFFQDLLVLLNRFSDKISFVVVSLRLNTKGYVL